MAKIKITYPQWHAMKILHDPEYRNNAPVLSPPPLVRTSQAMGSSHEDLAVHYFGVREDTISALGNGESIIIDCRY